MNLIGMLFALMLVVGCCLAGYSALGTKRVESQFPPIGDFVEIDGVRLHYVDVGTGDPLVLIHGASSTLLDFSDNLLAGLAKNHRVVAFDRPGFGYSERPDGSWPDPAYQAKLFNQALAELGIQKSVLIGYSWSASVALAYVLDYPDNSMGGVVLAGVTHPWNGDVYWTYDLAQTPVFGYLFAKTLVYPVGQHFLENVAMKVFAPNPVKPGHIARTGATLALRSDSFLANAEDCSGLSDFLVNQSQRYQSIRRPLLLITGDSDAIVPPNHHTDKLIKQVPGATVAVLENTGHALHHIHPETINRLIEEFADSLYLSDQPI